MPATPRSDKRDTRQLEERFNSASPFSRYEYVEVVFGTADFDTLVEHDLAPAYGDDVRYLVVGLSGEAVVYHDQSATRRPWETGYIYLRATAPVTAQLLLILPTETT